MTTGESQISERELEILRLVATGATNQQIAQELSISINTVKVHLRNIFGKIGVVSRTEATLYAVRNGLISLHGPDTAVVVVADEDDEDGNLDVTEPAPAVVTKPAPGPAPVAMVEPEPAPLVADTPVIPAQSVVQVPPTPMRRRTVSPLLLGLGGLVLVLALAIVLALILTQRSTSATPTQQANEQVAVPGTDERWRELAPLPEPRTAFALANVAFDGAAYLYAIAGDANDTVSDDVLRYDLASNVWVPFRAKPTTVADVQAAVIRNRIYVPGGRTASGEISQIFEAYDPQRDRWETLKPLPEPRSSYALAAVEGKLYLFGGWDGQTYRDDVWQYSPDRDEWETLTPLRSPRAAAGAAVLDGLIYIVGGEDENGPLALNESYNPAEEGISNPWSIQASLPTPRSNIGIAATNNLLFVFGGTDNADAADQALLYRDNLDAWEPLETPPTALAGLRAQAVGGKLYIFGGQSNGDASAKTYEYQAIYSVVLPALELNQ